MRRRRPGHGHGHRAAQLSRGRGGRDEDVRTKTDERAGATPASIVPTARPAPPARSCRPARPFGSSAPATRSPSAGSSTPASSRASRFAAERVGLAPVGRRACQRRQPVQQPPPGEPGNTGHLDLMGRVRVARELGAVHDGHSEAVVRQQHGRGRPGHTGADNDDGRTCHSDARGAAGSLIPPPNPCAGFTDDAAYAAMDFLLESLEEIAGEVFGSVAHLLNLDLDIVFETPLPPTGRPKPPTMTPSSSSRPTMTRLTSPTEAGTRASGHSKDHRGDLPQVVIAMAVTRDGVPVQPVPPGPA